MRCLYRLALIAFCFLVLGLSVARARGAGPDSRGASPRASMTTSRSSVEALAGSGDPDAARIIEALGDGRLLVRPSDKAVFIKTKSGEIVRGAKVCAAATGVAASGLKPVRINNRVRRAIDTAVGMLTLTSPNRDLHGSPQRTRSSRAGTWPLFRRRARAGQREGPGGSPCDGSRPPRRWWYRRQARRSRASRGGRRCCGIGATRMRRAVLASMPSDAEPGGPGGRRVRYRGHRSASGDPVGSAERHLRHQPRLRPAARGDRARHHLRRDGRHQHGAWRDGHAGRLRHVAHPGLLSDVLARGDDLVAASRRAGGLPRRRCRRRGDRADHHPLPLWAAARDPARDLRPIPDPPAAGAHGLRRVQPGGQHTGLDAGLDRALRGPDRHQQPHRHRDLLPDRLLLPARRHALHPLRARDARRDTEPPDGRRHGHPHDLGRRPDLRPRLRHRRDRRRRDLARSTMSARTSARATSSTASWSSSSAAWAISGARSPVP